MLAYYLFRPPEKVFPINEGEGRGNNFNDRDQNEVQPDLPDLRKVESSEQLNQIGLQ